MGVGLRTREEKMSFQNIIYEKQEKVVRLTLNRPEKLNALNDALLREFDAALSKAAEDPDVTALILKGNGRAFCSGYDVSGADTAETDFDFRSSPDVTELFKKQRRRQESLIKLARFPNQPSPRCMAFVWKWDVPWSWPVIFLSPPKRRSLATLR